MTIPFTPMKVYCHGGKDHQQNQSKKEVTDSNSTTNTSVTERVGISKNDLKHVVRNDSNFNLSLEGFPSFHPLVVHFPIVLILVSIIFQFISFFILKNEMSIAAIILLFLGFCGAYIATTFVHPHTEGLSPQAATVLKDHEVFATITVWLSALALLIKLISHLYCKKKLFIEILSFAILLGAGISVSISAHFGAQLVHVFGIGPMGKFLE